MKSIFCIAVCLIAINVPAEAAPRFNAGEQQLLRRWMRTLALNYFVARKARWSMKSRDCAGFIRYLVWESLQPHPPAWHVRWGSPLTRELPDLKKPKAKLFRGEGKSVHYASAETLLSRNSYSITRDRNSSLLKEGDILFFENANTQSRYHTMLLVKNTESNVWMVVYHTGQPKGQLKLMRLTTLLQHPQARWHPVMSNRRFLGFRRLYFLK